MQSSEWCLAQGEPSNHGVGDMAGRDLSDMPIASKPDKHCCYLHGHLLPSIHSWGLQSDLEVLRQALGWLCDQGHLGGWC